MFSPRESNPSGSTLASKRRLQGRPSARRLATLLSIGIEQRQQVLEIDDVVVRLQRVLELMKTGRQAA
jgi:hypothetical protein